MAVLGSGLLLVAGLALLLVPSSLTFTTRIGSQAIPTRDVDVAVTCGPTIGALTGRTVGIEQPAELSGSPWLVQSQADAMCHEQVTSRTTVGVFLLVAGGLALLSTRILDDRRRRSLTDAQKVAASAE